MVHTIYTFVYTHYLLIIIAVRLNSKVRCNALEFYQTTIYYYCSRITPITRIFFARATCFSTTEMTDLTDFVSIACPLRH